MLKYRRWFCAFRKWIFFGLELKFLIRDVLPRVLIDLRKRESL